MPLASLRYCLIALTLFVVVRDIGAERRRLAPAVVDTDLSSVSLGQSTAPAGLPGGGYLRYQRPAELEREACRASVAKEPVRGRLALAVVLAANEQLNLPMGVGRELTVRGRPYLFCLEPHYHPPGYASGPEGWHKGVTVYQRALPDVRKL